MNFKNDFNGIYHLQRNLRKVCSRNYISYRRRIFISAHHVVEWKRILKIATTEFAYKNIEFYE